MLATVLRSEKAVDASIRIMDAFVKMRHFIKDNNDIYKSLKRIDNKLVEHDEKLNDLFSEFDKKEKILLEGQSYDAYLNVLEILNNSSKSIIEKYNKQYHNLKVIRNNSFHDRFVTIDNKDIYHLGSSINSLGDKITAIIKLEDKKNIKSLLNTINKIIDNTNNI